jgi:hypothetical protein
MQMRTCRARPEKRRERRVALCRVRTAKEQLPGGFTLLHRPTKDSGTCQPRKTRHPPTPHPPSPHLCGTRASSWASTIRCSRRPCQAAPPQAPLQAITSATRSSVSRTTSLGQCSHREQRMQNKYTDPRQGPTRDMTIPSWWVPTHCLLLPPKPFSLLISRRLLDGTFSAHINLEKMSELNKAADPTLKKPMHAACNTFDARKAGPLASLPRPAAGKKRLMVDRGSYVFPGDSVNLCSALIKRTTLSGVFQSYRNTCFLQCLVRSNKKSNIICFLSWVCGGDCLRHRACPDSCLS